MTGPRRTPESPFASIRELAESERRIIAGQEAMKHELLIAIKASDEHHEHVHAAMREIGDQRHRRIDDFLGQEALDDAQRTGMMTAGVYTVRVFRFLNEFRWLLAALLLGAIFLAGEGHIDVRLQ